MNISLPPELETMVQAQVASGKYGDESAVIREALQQMLGREDEAPKDDAYEQWLKAEIAIGVAQADRGDVEDHDMQSIKDFVFAEHHSQSR